MNHDSTHDDDDISGIQPVGAVNATDLDAGDQFLTVAVDDNNVVLGTGPDFADADPDDGYVLLLTPEQATDLARLLHQAAERAAANAARRN